SPRPRPSRSGRTAALSAPTGSSRPIPPAAGRDSGWWSAGGRRLRSTQATSASRPLALLAVAGVPLGLLLAQLLLHGGEALLQLLREPVALQLQITHRAGKGKVVVLELAQLLVAQLDDAP